MIDRRRFLGTSAVAGLSWLTSPEISVSGAESRRADAKPGPAYQVDRHVAARLFDGKRCWCHPRAGIVPGIGRDGAPRVVMTMNTLHLEGSDVFKGMYSLYTDDLGKTWTKPTARESLAPRYEMIDGEKRPVAVSDFWPGWHKQTKTLLGTGHTVAYTTDWKVRNPRPRHTSFSIYDPASDEWSDWQKMEMPAGEEFADAGAGCVQRYDLPDGDILLPIYYRPPGRNSRVTVTRCAFDGKVLRYAEHGNTLSVDDKTRGLHEPSIARLGDMFYLTIRNDRTAFVTRSEDGLQYEPLRTWTFDDGSDLGSYNTQAHWATHGDALYLVYTRRGANNDHVFRHRAPLFMGQVDPERMCVIRDTEQVLVPERGARLGNFGVTDVSPDETWITVAEWMQPRGVEKHGSDGSVFVAQVRW
ncbi:MAG: sialidase family protein [Maioricimonas sp. JB049]